MTFSLTAALTTFDCPLTRFAQQNVVMLIRTEPTTEENLVKKKRKKKEEKKAQEECSNAYIYAHLTDN